MERFDLHTQQPLDACPEVSVIVSTYNRCRPEGECASLLKRAIDSILNQTFRNFELILINDFSKDNTESFCKEIALKDPRVRFYHFHSNSGLPAHRYNFGMSVSKGKYITFMFDDDELELNALQDLYNAIQSQSEHCGMVYGLATQYHGDKRDVHELLGSKWQWRKIINYNFIANNSVLVKKSAIDAVGGYDEDPIIIRVCDWDLWWRIGREFNVVAIDKKVSIVYSALSDSLECTKLLNLDACKQWQQTSRKIPLKKNIPRSIRSVIQSIAFDLTLKIITYGMRFKKWIKVNLPSLFQFLKTIRKKIYANISTDL